jgi:hypothetical protein
VLQFKLEPKRFFLRSRSPISHAFGREENVSVASSERRERGVVAKELWNNCRDSIVHALLHFSALRSEDVGFHNRKWIVLSVHHAAEVFCNYFLSEADSSYPPAGRYPSLLGAIDALKQHASWALLRESEKRAINELFPRLNVLRNSLMHRVPPPEIEVSDAAIAMLALLHLVARWSGSTADDFVEQYPPIESDVVDAIRWTDLDRYTRHVEWVVSEENPEAWNVVQCENCGGMTRLRYERHCRACFDDTAVDDD